MSQQNVNVICVFDTETTQENGPGVGATVYMISDQGPGAAGQGTNELTVTVNVGDTITWTLVPLISFMSVSFTSFVQTSGSGVLSTRQISSTQWQANCLGKGQVTYHFNLQIANDTNTYSWDPFITINP
ncbi:hypothetical protein [Niveispirillum cyanobacteriorum]|uniref:Uncharacterized protein n=1 Tax=Niveispirillum cyanobacteriorum TaxID=1612173 RepID=A0A2K9NKM3_9PROT|nr:hypothetical protein [Niveispirillum cyanobacteriorum]AUN33601.1 hypothetical protein C0V82_25010 [Niveispirillum cyanobacteriorum]GGE47100.1 hypothetical protein GCM10011317_01840 [Niveispirillum cyanobacteriorum]